MNTQNLISKSIDGDNDSFYQIINNYKEMLYRIAYTYFNNQEDALEAVQETTYRAYKNINKLKSPQYFKTWITRILINFCNDEIKRRKKIIPLKFNISSEIVEINENKLIIDFALNQLKSNYKQVILLKYMEDMKISEIAQIMDCPEGTVKSWLNRGLAELKKILSKGGEKIG